MQKSTLYSMHSVIYTLQSGTCATTILSYNYYNYRCINAVEINLQIEDTYLGTALFVFLSGGQEVRRLKMSDFIFY